MNIKKRINETDEFLKIGLNEEKHLLRETDVLVDVSAYEKFIKERNESTNYEFFNKIKMVFRNQFLGTTNFPPLLRKFYLNNDGTGNNQGYLPYNEFGFLRNDTLREETKLIGQTDLTNIVLEYEPKNIPEHRIISEDENPFFNWGFHLSYVDSVDENYVLNYTLSDNVKYDNVVTEGIPFRVVDDGENYVFTSPIKHNIKLGEHILISNKYNTFKKILNGNIVNTTNVVDRVFKVNSIGDKNYESDLYVFQIPKEDFISGTVLNKIVFVRRWVDRDNPETLSKYYVRKHKILTGERDYKLEKLGFEQNIFENERKILFENMLGENDVIVEKNRMETLLNSFMEKIKITELKNNLKQTPTELFLTIYFKNGNGLFNYPPKVGYKFNFHNGWIDKHFEGNSSNESGIILSHTQNLNGLPLVGGVMDKGLSVLGDLVEYNQYELKEYVMSNTFHKITVNRTYFDHKQNIPTINFTGVNNNNQIGLYYQTHYPIILKVESDYVETSNDKEIINLPENKYFSMNDNQWRWRDLYDHGFIDENGKGIDYPFLNNKHYIKNEINFYLRDEKNSIHKPNAVKNFNGRQDKFC